MLRLVVSALVICASIVTSAAQTGEKIDPVELKARPSTHVGKMIQIEGRMTSSNRVGGVILINGKNAGNIRVDFTWGLKEGEAYDKAMRECGVHRSDTVCDVSASGTYRAVEGISDFYVLEKASIRFLK